MIEYYQGANGIHLLFRLNGSALFKTSIFGIFSVFVYQILYHSIVDYYIKNLFFNEDAKLVADQQDYIDFFNHPYAIGVLIGAVSLLITFRANVGYQRYWEACTAVYSMMSKFMDAAVLTNVFYLQCDMLTLMRPKSFHDCAQFMEGRGLSRDRVRRKPQQIEKGQDEINANSDGLRHRPIRNRVEGTLASQIPFITCLQRQKEKRKEIEVALHHHADRNSDQDDKNEPHPFFGHPRLDGGWGLLYPNEITGEPTATYYDIQKLCSKASKIPPQDDTEDVDGFASTKGGRTAPLFLQELAHLSSLLCAVAMITLRNDINGPDMALETYIPGQPWPPADSIKLSIDEKVCAHPKQWIKRNLQYLFGMDQTKEARARYNANRPMLVIGGISDNELAFLQKARGSAAKVQLCWTWLSEFIVREHLAGSLGEVAPPIVTRVLQFLSDGMLYYNQARKIMWIPFPFPHAQLSAFYVFVITFAIPFLMKQYANQVWLGSSLTFFVVTCLCGFHEVARALENPFRNAPNDVPLCALLAFYNEALVTMFAGFHPDSNWEEFPETPVTDRGGVGGKMVPDLSTEMDHSTADQKYQFTSPTVEQSVNEIENLTRLREMVEMQATAIKEMQNRIMHIKKQNVVP